MLSTPKVFLKTAQFHLDRMCISNNPTLENHFVNLPQHWMSNQILPYAGYVLLNKSASQ